MIACDAEGILSIQCGAAYDEAVGLIRLEAVGLQYIRRVDNAREKSTFFRAGRAVAGPG